MIGIAFMLLGAAAAMPCESLTTLKLDNAVITSAEMVAEGPAPARGGGQGRAAAAGPRGDGPGAAQPGVRGAPAGGGAAPQQAPAGGPPAAPAIIPAHCRVQLDLKPSSDSMIKMEMWLPPVDKWNGKFMGVGNGGFAGSIQGLATDMPPGPRLRHAPAGPRTGRPGPGGAPGPR